MRRQQAASQPGAECRHSSHIRKQRVDVPLRICEEAGELAPPPQRWSTRWRRAGRNQLIVAPLHFVRAVTLKVQFECLATELHGIRRMAVRGPAHQLTSEDRDTHSLSSERDVRFLANVNFPAERKLIEISESRYILGENGDAFEMNRHTPTVARASDMPAALPLDASLSC